MEADPYAAPATTEVGEPSLLKEPVAIRSSHILHEAAVRSMGVLYLFAAGFALIQAAVFISRTANYPRIMPYVVVPSVLLVAGMVWIGLGLRKLKRPARNVAIILSAMALIAVPIGTVLGAWNLHLLLSRKGKMVFSPEYQDAIAATPELRCKSPLPWMILIAIGVVVLGSLFSLVMRAAL